MGKKTDIGWTDHTFNAWWICVMVSLACALCYAERWAARWGWKWGRGMPRRVWPHNAKHWQEPRTWDKAAARAGVRRRCFTASMSDILDADTDPRDPALIGPSDPPFWDLDAERAELWKLMEATLNLDWLALSKRPENWLRMVPAAWLDAWPHNVWVGATTENAEQAALRWVWIIELVERCRVRPPVLFASVEPIVGPINFSALPPLSVERAAQLLRGLYGKEEALELAQRWRALWDVYVVRYGDGETLNIAGNNLLDWVITGGESDDAGHARPWHPGWVRALRDRCVTHGIAFFHKQHGEWIPEDQLAKRPSFKVQSFSFPPRDGFASATCWHVGRRKTGNVLDEQVWEQFPQR